MTLALLAGIAEARTGRLALTVSGDERMTADLKELAQEFEKTQPLAGDSLALLQGAQALASRLGVALRSRGFYDGALTATVDGHPIAEPAALDAIEAHAEGDTISFTFDIGTGQRYRVGTIAIRPPGAMASLPAIDRSKLDLAPGDPADAAAIIAAQDKLLAELRKQGYALAAIKDREVVVDHATHEAEVTFIVESGPTARMGPVSFSGSAKVDMVWLQRRVPFKEGEPYQPAKVDALRGKLTSLGVFNAVRIKPATALDAEGELPIEVDLTDRPSRSIGFGISYETRVGIGVDGFWTHRNLFGQAESLRLSAELSHLGEGAAILDTGFAFRAAFRKPDWWFGGQDARLEGAALREVVDAYTRKAVTLYAGLDRTITPQWQVRGALAGEISEVTRFGATRDYRLIGVPLAVIHNRTDSDLDPTKGYRLQLDATPWLDTEPGGALFAIMRLTARAYFDLAEPGRTVLATRASLGTEPASSVNSVPADKLLYAGGGGSVRGFVYQSAGPRDAYNRPLGGASVVEASLELRQRIGESFGVVAFIDAGSAYPDPMPNFSLYEPRVGVGIGLRYYTGFGPVRLDVGVPLNKRDGDPPFGIYVSLGHSF